jgi:hypothetical protein
MTDRHEELIKGAVRLWTAAESLDAIHGGEGAWRWTHRQIARLTREGRHEDPNAVREVARVLERRLAKDRDQVEA